MVNYSLGQGPEKVQVTYPDAVISTSRSFGLQEHGDNILEAWQNLEKTQPLTILLM